MMAAASRDWSVFKQIFADHWEPFQHAHPRYQTAYYDDLVAKMLACGNPEKMGYVEYRCLQCGQGKHLEAVRVRATRRDMGQEDRAKWAGVNGRDSSRQNSVDIPRHPLQGTTVHHNYRNSIFPCLPS